jgi:flavin-dependent dehydrogenase
VLDVIVVGAGPAGSIAGLVLARAGARVLLVDRETFPRDKLCGDSLNPGALALLASLGIGGGPLTGARAMTGMVLTGPRPIGSSRHHRVAVRTAYGGAIVGRTIRRSDLDVWLLEQAIASGARFESSVAAREPLVAAGGASPVVRGLVLSPRDRPASTSRIPASLVIAADGAHSSLARMLGLSRRVRRPRRWAYGAYVAGIRGLGDVGEMHVGPASYLGVAPIDDELANVCLVTTPLPGSRDPLALIKEAIAADEELADRCRDATFGPPRSLGPLAASATAAGVEGLLLAGDAGGFIDPITGDGVHLAMEGGRLAAEEALRALETSDFSGAAKRLAEARRRRLGAKLRFNLAIRWVTSSPNAIALASLGGIAAPGVFRHVVRYAGDIPRVRPPG